MAEINVTGTRTREYKDLNLTFGRNPVTNDVLTLTGAEAVKRSIKTLLNTNAGEVPFFPTFGTRLNRLLFEPVDPLTTILIESEIRATITAYEPRTTVRSLTVTATPDAHAYQIDLTLQLNNLVEPVTLTLFLSRLR
jgi:phage baseplate assembly protein W